MLIHGVPAVFYHPDIQALAFVGYIIGIVVRTGLPSFIVTLGFWFASRGFAVFLSQTLLNQSRLSVKSELKPPAGGGEDPTWIDNVFAFDKAFGLPFDAEVYYFAILVIIVALVLHKTKYGNWIYAAGGDPTAARAVGVPVIASKSAFSWCRPVLPVFGGADGHDIRGVRSEGR